MSGQANPQRISRLKTVSKIIGLAVVAVGSVVLLGWVTGNEVLKSAWPGLVTMKTNTAICFVLAGVALWLLCPEPTSTARLKAARVCSLLLALVALLTLVEYLSDRDLGIDQLLFREVAGAVGTGHPNRMAPTTAANFLLLGAALLLLDWRRSRRPSQILTLIAVIVSLMALIGYIYGIKSLAGIAPYTRMAVNTSVTFLALCLGVLSARPERGVMKVVTSDAAGGALARQLLPYAFVLPVLLGWLRLQGERAGLYETEIGVALIAVSSIVLFAMVVWLYARSLNKTDTERQQAEAALRESENRFRATFEQAAVGIAHVATDGRWLRVNQRLCDIIGYTREELLSHTFQDITHPDDLVADLKYVRQMLAGEIQTYSMEKRYIRKDRSVVWINLTVSLLHELSGAPKHFVSVVEDITERKRMEASIRETEHRWRTLLEGVHLLVAGLDRNGNTEYVNPFFLEVTGYARDEVIGKHWFTSFVPPAQRQDAEGVFLQMLGKEFHTPYQNPILAKNGEARMIEWFSTRLRDPDGNVVGTLSIGQDITERQRAEEALARFNRLAVGREQRMIELKREVNELQKLLSQPPSYDLSFLKSEPPKTTPSAGPELAAPAQKAAREEEEKK